MYIESSTSYTPSTTLPVARADVKKYLRVTHSQEDDLIDTLIIAAGQYLAETNGLLLLPATVTQIFNRVPASDEFFGLTRGPVTTLTSVQCNTEDDLTTWVNLVGTATLNAAFNNPRVYCADGWGFAGGVTPNQVKIVYTAGYADAASIPHPIKLAIMLMVAEWYENRQDVERKAPTMASQTLVQPYALISKV